jgi:hypothetical protein
MSRLDFVTVTYSRSKRDPIAIPWASRDALLDEIAHVDSARGIVDAFKAVGASAPVTLSLDDAVTLIGLLDAWADRVAVDKLPEGVWGLRNALHDDVHDTST